MSQLKNKKKKNNKRQRNESPKMSHRDVAALLQLQQNPAVLHQYQQMPEQQRKRRKLQIQAHKRDTRPREDFLTQCLVRWSLVDLLDITALLLEVIAHRDPNNHEDTLFADNTTIWVSEGDTRSFADYYRLVFDSANETIGATTGLATEHHHSNLLRACFVIAFVHEPRVRRFVMARDSIHTHYMQPQPPTPDTATRYIADVVPIVDDFLFAGRISILEMVEMCYTHWLSHYMLHTTQTPLTKNIEVRT